MVLDYFMLRTALAAPALAALPDADAAQALNGRGKTVARKVPTFEARGLLLRSGEWGALKLLSRSTAAPDALVAAAITAVDTLELTETLDTDEPDVLARIEAMLGGFVAAGALSAKTRDALLALGQAWRPAWPVAITAADVATARRL